MTNGSLAVERLGVWAGTKPLVIDVTFSVQPGAAVALIGPSGGGKSTIINAIAGVTAPELRLEGRITYPSGRTVDMAVGSPHEPMGYLPQHALDALNPVVGVGTVLTEIARRRTGTDDTMRMQEAVAVSLAGLGFSDAMVARRPSELSAGERQRVLLAATTLGYPGLIIADEPTASVDALTRAEVLEWMLTTARGRQLPVLFATHDYEAVRSYCASAVVLRSGRVDAIIKPTSLSRRELMPPRMNQPGGNVLEVRQASVTIGRHRILDGINLKANAGSVTGLLGRNGSGKSTLARCVAGLEPPDTGEVLLHREGQTVRVRAPSPRVQLVFQDPHSSFDPRRTIARSMVDAVATARHRKDLGRIREEVIAAMDQVGVANDVVERQPWAVSGGECQRAAVVRAALLQPDVLIADEPTASLDVESGNSVLRLLGQLARQSGISVILITHDVVAASQLCDHIVLLESGRVIAEGPLKQVMALQPDWHKALTKL